ncbi:LLM class flavin-dependent oxidoreductase [Yinghuangia seranimata]|uniref:LLM class flavin-dependent oxidoreductase n=1 Tax=Yinghuangia seranimata TaxID=408067 RepID=UPI00248B2F27|nr:LLM class flavin-dependent oxidoreductase [Yinghuangia seranimata]MDI2132444.1 LLM class flavin-dependent oxidoreductase [Yinghuangia seranimata]
MRITYGPWGETLDELADAARRAERAGAEVLWVPELHRSATVPVAALAQATETARVGTGIALAFTRSPMVQALEALDLDELSRGRFILGLGTGVQRLNEDWHNARFGKPVAHLRETVRNLRAFWDLARNGVPIDLPGEHEPMRIRGYQRPFHQQRDTIPVYLAAMGPAMTRLAGEIADGWISHELHSARYLSEAVLPELEKGLARGGRSRGRIDVVASVLCAIDDDPARAKRWAAGTVGFYASVRTYADFWAFHGLAEEQQAVVAAFRGGLSADDLADAAPDHMVDAVTASGTADDVRAKILSFAGIADSVKLSPPAHSLDASVTRRCQDRIIDLIATL